MMPMSTANKNFEIFTGDGTGAAAPGRGGSGAGAPALSNRKLDRRNLPKPGARTISGVVKMVFDVTVAAGLLCFLAPVMLALAAAIALDGGPVFFAHERVGLYGRKFRCLKFRSMVTNPDEVLSQHLANNTDAAAEWRLNQKLKHDPRVTRVGRVLRSTSLDELPQLLNVVRLQMSLVGPRPIVTNEVVRYGDSISYYLAVRPGLTGLWQVSGRSNTTYQRRIELDADYVKNWSFWRDVEILAKTIPVVVVRSGAH